MLMAFCFCAFADAGLIIAVAGAVMNNSNSFFSTRFGTKKCGFMSHLNFELLLFFFFKQNNF